MEHPENDEAYKGLKVNSGVEDVPTVNPYLKKRVKRRQYTPAEYVEGILKGNITILSQAVTLVESSKHEHQQLAQEIIEKCLPFAGNSMRIGITGVPGAGKSTSIDVFGIHLLKQGHKLAVLAIDPSSERSKGSILGDKTRMEALSREKNAFIRPSPSAGSLGGVARKTRETIILCEAAGFDTVFVETVGVGQSETAVHSMVDFFLLIQLAGTGDELQGINLFPPAASGWFPKVLTYSGYYNIGIKEIWDMVDEYMAFTKKNGYFEYKRREQAKYWMYESINDTLRDTFYNNPQVSAQLEATEKQVLANAITPFIAAKRMMDLFLGSISGK